MRTRAQARLGILPHKSMALHEGTSGTRWSTGLRRSVAASAAWGAPEGAPAPASPSRRSTEGTAHGAKSVPRSTVAQNLFRKGKESSYETVSPRTRARRAQAVNPERGSEDAPGRVVQTAGGGCHAIVPVLVRALELHRRLVQTRGSSRGLQALQRSLSVVVRYMALLE